MGDQCLSTNHCERDPLLCLNQLKTHVLLTVAANVLNQQPEKNSVASQRTSQNGRNVIAVSPCQANADRV